MTVYETTYFVSNIVIAENLRRLRINHDVKELNI